MNKQINSKKLGKLIKDKIIDSLDNKPAETVSRPDVPPEEQFDSRELGDILKEKILDSINNKPAETVDDGLKEEK